MSQEQYELRWKDYYQVLGVNPQSEQEVIAAAYRAMAKKYHTDKTTFETIFHNYRLSLF